MCGIVGIISNQSHQKINLSLDKIAHRGPDSHGIYSHENLSLGHRRLSIIDLSENGHQPMISNCGNFVLIFNGEIYNFMELRKELIDLGHIFKTNSDTEVIVHGYEEYI